MVDFKAFDEILGQIQAQYRDTNIKEFIGGIIEIKRKYIYMAIKSLLNDNLSISTAKGIGLDLWGNLLHLSRYIPSDKGDNYAYFNFNVKNFKSNGGLIFYNANKPNYASLDDLYYRQLLLILYQGYFLNSDIPNLTLFSRESLSAYGDLYIRDSLKMDWQIYVFNSKIPVWLNFMMSNFDILPRPAGVGSKIIERIVRRFGFGVDSILEKPRYDLFNFNKKNFNKIVFFDESNNYYPDYIKEYKKAKFGFFNFNKANFLKTIFYDKINDDIYSKKYYFNGYKGKIITKADYERRKLWSDKN
ncbi:DUF2612 domain-containing protein, partial [Campylobacter lanienae]|uniref:DUF2612 domain-containing protein n=1 Tax=Campylobacter lanienae TaxID=75658 RepID=UPI00242F7965